MVVRGDEAYRPRRRAEIEVIANSVRDVLGITGRVHGSHLFNHLDELVLIVDNKKIPVDYGVKDLNWGVMACSQYDPPTGKIDVFLAPDTYDQLERGNPRALFTLIHECGHVILHTDELIDRATKPLDLALHRRKQHPVYRDTEWQSDTFAGASIAPLHDVLRLHDQLGYITIKDVARAFGLSNQASEIRLANIEQLTNRTLTRTDRIEEISSYGAEEWFEE